MPIVPIPCDSGGGGGDIRPLECDIDSVTICPGEEPIPVEFDGEVNTRPLDCDTDSVTVCQPVVTANLVNVPASLTSITVLPANPARKGAIFWNDSTSNCFLKLGSSASTTSFTVRIAGNTFYQLNIGYVGDVDAIWSAPLNGTMRITEFV